MFTLRLMQPFYIFSFFIKIYVKEKPIHNKIGLYGFVFNMFFLHIDHQNRLHQYVLNQQHNYGLLNQLN